MQYECCITCSYFGCMVVVDDFVPVNINHKACGCWCSDTYLVPGHLQPHTLWSYNQSVEDNSVSSVSMIFTNNRFFSDHTGEVGASCLDICPLHAKFFMRDIKIYLQFESFLHTHMTQVAEILPLVRHSQELTYSVESISSVLMTWQCKEPGYQQLWFWWLLNWNNSVPTD